MSCGPCCLTHGGFYLHFRSKAELRAETQRHLPAVTTPALGPLDDLFGEHSAWSSLALDVGSSTPEVRRGYAQTLQAICARLGEEMADSPHGETAAQAVAAMLVGALAVARTVDDPALRHRIGEACRKAARALREPPGAEEPLFFWSLADADIAHPPLH